MRQTKKILIVSTNSDEAGAPRHCETIINGLGGLYEFEFVSGQIGPVYNRLQARGVKSSYIAKFNNNISPIDDLLCILKLYFIVRKSRPDILHLHSAKAGLIGRIVGFLLDIPVIYTVHGFPWRGMSKLKYLVIRLVEYVFAKIPNIKYVFVSHSMKNEASSFLKINPSSIHIVHNGVYDLKIESRLERRSRLRIIMPARVCDAKDHITLFKSLSSISTPFSLVLCGAGTNEQPFIDKATHILADSINNVEFLGERNDVTKLLERSDVLVLSSFYEAMPLSIIEAMSASLPVVASNTGGVKEIITKDTGFIFEVGDVNTLSNCLDRLANEELRISLGKNGRKRFIKYFSSEIMLNKLSYIYNTISD